MRSARLLISALFGALVGLYLATNGRQPPGGLLDGLPGQAIKAQVNSASLTVEKSLYDPNPDHIWNRLHRALYVRVTREGREYGGDVLDPLLWHETSHLLGGQSHQRAIGLLDEFLSTGAERSIADPLRRALLQRDLWAIFDWSTGRQHDFSREGRQLQIRLARVIRRLALPKEQIEKLPNNYTDAVASKAYASEYDKQRPHTAFLPPDLFSPVGPWVQLSNIRGEPVALEHAFDFTGRSAFLVFIRLPAGREATLAYIKKLHDFPEQWNREAQEPERLVPNPRLPQFPAGTQLALVRQMMLIDDKGYLTATNLIEKVQIRVHKIIPTTIPEGVNLDSNEAATSLDVFEFKLSRKRLFAAASGGLRAATLDDKEFSVFKTHGVDLFEREPGQGFAKRHQSSPLRSCSGCHFRPGVHSMLSRRLPRLVASWDPKNEVNIALNWKRNRYEWGLLSGLWESRLERAQKRQAES